MCFRKKNKKVAEKPAKKEPTKKAAKTKKQAAPAKKTEATRVYHVVKREDGKWAVKYAGGEKTIKLFDNQKEAIAYTKKMADNQEGAMLVHTSRGKHKGRIQ